MAAATVRREEITVAEAVVRQVVLTAEAALRVADEKANGKERVFFRYEYYR